MCLEVVFDLISGLALDMIWCSPFCRVCDNFKSQKKKITKKYDTKTFLIVLSHISLKILHFFKVQG